MITRRRKSDVIAFSDDYPHVVAAARRGRKLTENEERHVDSAQSQQVSTRMVARMKRGKIRLLVEETGVLLICRWDDYPSKIAVVSILTPGMTGLADPQVRKMSEEFSVPVSPVVEVPHTNIDHWSVWKYREGHWQQMCQMLSKGRARHEKDRADASGVQVIALPSSLIPVGTWEEVVRLCERRKVL